MHINNWMRLQPTGLLLLGLLLAGCQAREPGPGSNDNVSTVESNDAEPVPDCCALCGQFARQDPAGMDLRTSPCRRYADAVGTPQTCAQKWSEDPGILVGDCL